jgi:hypothetical protein
MLMTLVMLGQLPSTIASSAPVSWRGVVSFISAPEEASEDWNWFNDDISKACAEGKSRMDYEGANPKKVKVGPRDQTVDVSPYLKKFGQGWLLVRDGKIVKALQYDIATRDEAIEFCRDGVLK